jgi:hypothetical protein
MTMREDGSPRRWARHHRLSASGAAPALVTLGLALVGCPEHAPVGLPTGTDVASTGVGGSSGSMDATTSSDASGTGGNGSGGAASSGVGSGAGGAMPQCKSGAWGQVLRVGGERHVARVRIAEGGDLLVAGDFTGTLTLTPSLEAPMDTFTMTASGRDAFVARFDPCGAVRWVARSGGVGDERAEDLAIVEDEAVLAVAYSKGLGFQSALAAGSDGDSGALVRLGAEGGIQAAKALGVLGNGTLRLEPSGDGGLYVAGTATGKLEATGPALEPKGKRDVFLQRWTAEGAPVWTRRWGTASDEGISALAVASDGVWFAGFYTAPLAFDGPTLPSFKGLPLGHLVKVSPAGKVLTSVKYTELILLEPTSLAAAPDGSLWLTETLVKAIDGGLFTFGHVLHLGSSGTSVLGELVYGQDDSKSQSARGLALLPGGHALVVGSVDGKLKLGGTTLDVPSSDVLLFDLDSKGNTAQVKTYGGTFKEQFGDALALGPSGEFAVAGRFDGVVNLPGAELNTSGPSFFVARLLTAP